MLAIVVLILAIFDSLFTYYGVDKGLIIEKNPLMSSLIEVYGVEYFLIVKIILSIVCVSIIQYHSDRKWARFFLFVVGYVYLAIFAMHISGLFGL